MSRDTRLYLEDILQSCQKIQRYTLGMSLEQFRQDDRTYPELHGCHTQAKSLDKLMERVKEAIELCLEVQGDENWSLSHP